MALGLATKGTQLDWKFSTRLVKGTRIFIGHEYAASEKAADAKRAEMQQRGFEVGPARHCPGEATSF